MYKEVFIIIWLHKAGISPTFRFLVNVNEVKINYMVGYLRSFQIHGIGFKQIKAYIG